MSRRNQHLKRHLQAHEKEESPSKRTSKTNKRESQNRANQKLLLTESSRTKNLSSPSSSPSTCRAFFSSTSSSLSPFVCSFVGCGKNLASIRSLNAHMNIHGGVRFPCSADGCIQSYPTLKSLKRHEREAHGTRALLVLCPDTPTESELEEGENFYRNFQGSEDLLSYLLVFFIYENPTKFIAAFIPLNPKM